MKFHKILIIVILINFALVSNHLTFKPSEASIHPMITTEMPEFYTHVGVDTFLVWSVIDDDPKSYTIHENGQLWKKEILISNVINVSFSRLPGEYQLNLTVFDYSGNLDSSVIYIKLLPYDTSGSNAASSGVNIFELFPLFLILTVIKRKISKKKAIK